MNKTLEKEDDNCYLKKENEIDIENLFTKLDINIKDINGEYRNLHEIFSELSEKWDKLKE